MNDAISLTTFFSSLVYYTETCTVANLTKQGIKTELFYDNWLFYYR